MRTLLIVVAAATGGACAGASGGASPAAAPVPAAAEVMRQAATAEPPKPRDIDPSGSYAVSLTYGGAPLSITVTFAKRQDGTYGGSVYVQEAGTIPFNAVTVSGKAVQATLTSPDGAGVTMAMTIDGDDVTGEWRSTTGDGSPLSGKRIP